MLTCELDVQILDQDRWPLIAQRCVNRAGAEFVAASYRRAFLRQGWKDRSQRVI